MAFLLTIKNDILHIVPKEVPLLGETLLCPSYGNLLAVKVPSEYSEAFISCSGFFTEEIVRRCSLRSLLRKNSLLSQENTCAEVSLLINVQAYMLQFYIKKDCCTGVFLWILRIISEKIFCNKTTADWCKGNKKFIKLTIFDELMMNICWSKKERVSQTPREVLLSIVWSQFLFIKQQKGFFYFFYNYVFPVEKNISKKE